MRNMRKHSIRSAIILCAVFLYLLGSGTHALAQPATLLGSRAPEVRAVSVKNENIQVPARGEVTVVVFWNSRYRLSLDALVGVERIWEAYGEKGIACVGFNDMGEDDRVVRQLIDQMKIGFPLASGPASSSAAVSYKLRGVPAIFVIDRSGAIIHVREGWDRRAESEIKQALVKTL